MPRLTVVLVSVVASISLLTGGVGDSAWSAAPPPPPPVTPSPVSGGCNIKLCDYGGGASGQAPGQANPPSGGSGGGGGSSGGPTTCTATDYSKNPPVKVTGPISSKRAYGPGGALLPGGELYFPSPQDPPGPNDPEPPGLDGETGGHWYVIYCGGVLYELEYVPDGSAPTAAGGVDPATVVADARAHLPLKPPTIHMNPDPAKGPAIVGMATWFWVNPQDVGTVPAGASQDGVVVNGSVAADHITVDPGDNTGKFTCPGFGTEWEQSVTASNCSHVYTDSSVGHGQHDNFIVTVTVSWRGNFTVSIGGVPAGGGTLGPIDETSQAPVRVGEVQALNTR